MTAAPRIPELGQRDRFVRRAVQDGRVLTLRDEAHASVQSQKTAGRMVQLFWSSPVEAKRWAQALSGKPALQELTLETFAADILPGLASANRFVGTDWLADPVEAEVDAIDLQLRLKAEAVPGYLRQIAERGEVFLVAGSDGPLILDGTGVRGAAGHAIEVFTSRLDAERAMRSSGGKTVIADSFRDFLSSTVPWAAARGLDIRLEPVSGAGSTAVPAEGLAALLAAS